MQQLSLSLLDCRAMAKAAMGSFAGTQRHRRTFPRYKHKVDLREGDIFHSPRNFAWLRISRQTLSFPQASKAILDGATHNIPVAFA